MPEHPVEREEIRPIAAAAADPRLAAMVPRAPHVDGLATLWAAGRALPGYSAPFLVQVGSEDAVTLLEPVRRLNTA